MYERVIDLRNRLSNDGSGEIYEEDHLLLDEVLDYIESNEQRAQEEAYNDTVDIYRELEIRKELKETEDLKMKKESKKVCKKCGEFITKGIHPDDVYECPYCDEYLSDKEIKTIDITGHKVGECPVCKGNLTYAKLVTSGLKEGYGWKCEDCDSQGIEWKEMRFVGHQIVFNSTE